MTGKLNVGKILIPVTASQGYTVSRNTLCVINNILVGEIGFRTNPSSTKYPVSTWVTPGRSTITPSYGLQTSGISGANGLYMGLVTFNANGDFGVYLKVENQETITGIFSHPFVT